MEILFDPPETLLKSLQKVIEPRHLELLKRSFEILLDSPSRLLFDFGVPLDIDLLIGKTHNPQNKTRLSVIYLNSLSDPSDKDYFLSLFMKNLYRWMLQHPISNNTLPQLILFMDELGQHIPHQNQTKPLCKDVTINVFKQSRKYGVVCLGASQSPGDFDYRALGQTNAMAVGRLKTPQEWKKTGAGISR